VSPGPISRAARPFRLDVVARLLFFALICLAPTASRSEPTREYQLKAAFLFNFSQFVEWPESSFANADAPFVIGVLGKDPFGNFLDQLVRGEHVQSRSVHVRRFDDIRDVEDCQILFVARSEAPQWKAIVDEMRGRSVLTVTDGDGVVSNDGIIRFSTASGKIRLVVDLDAARQSDLRISSKLLRTAEVVDSSKG
jgi:hypothetical protein